MDSYGSGQGTVKDCYEHGNELSCSIKCREFPLATLINKDSAP